MVEKTENSEEDMSEVDSKENVETVKFQDIASSTSYALKVFNECDTVFRLYTSNDEYAKKKDTVMGIISILEKMKGKHALIFLYFPNLSLTYKMCSLFSTLPRSLTKRTFSIWSTIALCTCLITVEF